MYNVQVSLHFKEKMKHFSYLLRDIWNFSRHFQLFPPPPIYSKVSRRPLVEKHSSVVLHLGQWNRLLSIFVLCEMHTTSASMFIY
jgi:hypothetical protein